MTKFRIWLFKWRARLMGGEAVWVKSTHTGKIFLCIARAQFDPFKDGEPALEVKIKGEKCLLHVNGTLWENHYAKWRYMDESKHVQHTLTHT